VEARPIEPKVRVYWSPSPGISLGGFVPEDRVKLQQEHSLYFSDHTYSVRDDEEWKHCPKDRDGRPIGISKVFEFIENHSAFTSGRIRRVKSAEEAISLTAAQAAARQSTKIGSEDVTVDLAVTRAPVSID
jgi:hypothetical protein